MAQTYDLTKGKTLNLILKFYFPLLLTNMLQQIYNIADTIIVGKGISDNALAAVGNTSNLSFFIVGFSMGLASGFAIPMAQSFGACNYSELRRLYAASIKLSAVITIITTSASIIFLRPVLTLLQTSEILMHDTLCYGYIIFGGLAASMAYNLFAAVLRALGDSKTPFAAIIISTAVNIILDIFFIFALKSGIAGAAFATVISQVISSVICFIKLQRTDILKIKRNDFSSPFSMNMLLLKNGLPMAFMNSITALGCMVVQYFVNGLGVAYASAYSVCSKYINFFMQPAATSGIAMSSFTSQNFGAKKYLRIKEGLRVCLGISFVSYLIFGSLMFFIPEFLASLMLSSPERISIAAGYFPICGIMLILLNFLFVFRNGCQGMGYPLVPLISGFAEMIIRTAAIWFMIDSEGFNATAYADVLAWSGALTLNLMAFIIFLNKKIRKENKRCKYKQRFSAQH